MYHGLILMNQHQKPKILANQFSKDKFNTFNNIPCPRFLVKWIYFYKNNITKYVAILILWTLYEICCRAHCGQKFLIFWPQCCVLCKASDPSIVTVTRPTLVKWQFGPVTIPLSGCDPRKVLVESINSILMYRWFWDKKFGTLRLFKSSWFLFGGFPLTGKPHRGQSGPSPSSDKLGI